MREQVIPQGAGRSRSAGKGRAPGGAAQRPAPRRSRPAPSGAARPRQKAFEWKNVLRYAPLLAKLTLAVTLGVLAFVGYRTAASASFFQVKRVDVDGVSRASREEIRAVVTGIAGRTGVWRADLETISEEIERLPWVRSAIVSRVLPSGVRVRVTERTPAVIARTSQGRLVWVDGEGVMLGAASPGEDEFFIRGLDEARSDLTRQQNRERVRVATELAREWQAANLSRRVSEINLDDLRDVRVQLAGADAHVEVRLGKEDYVKRFRQALEVLDAQRGTPRGPFVTYVDVSQGKRAVVGTGASAHIPAASVEGDGAGETQGAAGADGGDGATPQPARDAAAKKESRRQGVKQKEGGREKKRTTERRAESATRPRRVG